MKTIPLTKGYVALVDDGDFDRLSAYNWQAIVRQSENSPCVYARRSFTIPKVGNKKQGCIFMHCEILKSEADVDHEDGNGLNNQRDNLRPASKSQNQFNKRKSPGKASRFKGVTWDRNLNKWKAYICKDRKLRHLGYFLEEIDAANAYNLAAELTFGEFAKLNNLTEAELC